MVRRAVKHFLVLAAGLAALCAQSGVLATEEVLFEDSFDGDLSRWTIVHGDWLIKEGKVEGGGHGSPALRTKQEFDGDLIVEFTGATVPPFSHDIQCILFTNGYYFLLGSGRNTASTVLRQGHPVATTNRMTIEPGREYAVKIMRRGGTVEFIVDGKLVLSWTDEHPLASGPVSYTHLTLPTN